jgi:uncharacterized tellurite resistance protein B-like protein|tara:strand:- start:3 stop:641 length:639 start_codon:yes stop_codon:yes gene_type:complete
MFFLIFGTRASKRTVGSGMFFCPNEQSDQSYRQVAVKRMGHLFFIPLLPLGDLGEYVECESCGGTYRPEVLSLPSRQQLQTSFVEAVTRLVVEVILADGYVAEAERNVALGVVNQYLGSSGLSRAQLEKMIADAEAASPDDRSRNLSELLPELSTALSIEGRELLIRIALLLAAADGRIDESETKVIADAAYHLGLSKTRVRELVAGSTPQT